MTETEKVKQMEQIGRDLFAAYAQKNNITINKFTDLQFEKYDCIYKQDQVPVVGEIKARSCKSTDYNQMFLLEKDKYEDKFNLYMNNEEEQIKPLIKSKTEIFKNYSCGYCAREIIIPQYMYNDQVFCTTRCRSNLIQRKENYKMKGQSVSFSL